MSLFSARRNFFLLILLLFILNADCLMAQKQDVNTGSNVTVFGFIKDVESNLGIPGVQIFEKNNAKGTVSNKDGHYSIAIPKGSITLQFSFIGYQKQTERFSLTHDTILNIYLDLSQVYLDELIIRSDKNISSANIGKLEISTKKLKSLSSLAGEPDMLKSIELLPGVQSVGENANGINVRGGKTDQNLILIENAPLFNTSHMFGMVSAINTDLTKNVTLYKGTTPAYYGGRASSVLEVEIADGNSESVEGAAGIGVFNTKLHLNGPIIDSNFTFNFWGRTSYANWILKRIPDDDIRNSRASFYDLTGKISYKLNEKHRFSAFTYYSYDNFRFNVFTDYSFTNLLAGISHLWKLSYRTNLSVNYNFSNYYMTIYDRELVSNPFELKNGIERHGFRLDMFQVYNDRISYNVGIEELFYTTSPGEINYPETQDDKSFKLDNESSLLSVAYAHSKLNLINNISIQTGIRLSKYSSLHAEPRLSVKIPTGKNSSLKGGYTRTVQYLQMISNSAVMAPTDFWKLSNTHIRPLNVNQYVAGFFRNFNQNSIEHSIEIYYKDMRNVIDYKNGAKLILNDKIEEELLLGIGKAYGVEFLLKKNAGKFTGWLAYTWSRSFHKMNGTDESAIINDGSYYPSSFDKPHDISIVFNYHFSNRVAFNANFVYSSGRAITLPEQKYRFDHMDIVRFSDRNAYRLKPFHRLNIGLTVDSNSRKNSSVSTRWAFSLYNLYGRNNAYSVYYKNEVPNINNNYQHYAMYELSIIGIPVPAISIYVNFK